MNSHNKIISIGKISELSEINRSLIQGKLLQVQGDIAQVLTDLELSLVGKGRNFKKSGLLRDLKDPELRKDIDYYKTKLLAVLEGQGIIFQQPPKINTLLLLVSEKKIGNSPYRDNKESYTIFFESYGYKLRYNELLIEKRNRVTAMSQSISEFNRNSSQTAGFKLRTRSTTTIISTLSLDKRLSIGTNGFPYGRADQIKEYFEIQENKNKLLRQIKVWGWQRGWSDFANDENTQKYISIRGWNFQSDVRLLQDLFELKSIEQGVILGVIGIKN